MKPKRALKCIFTAHQQYYKLMTENKKLILSLGSNYNQERNIIEAISQLKKMFGKNNLVASRQMWTNPVDIKSDKFLNCMLFTHTSCKLDEVERCIKELECICGRTKEEKNKNIVKIDIDILLYGDKKLHDKDWARGYVKELMKECPF